MVYLAGDNNLQDFALKDLVEMKQAGSTGYAVDAGCAFDAHSIAIVAQLDRMADSISRGATTCAPAQRSKRT